MEEEGHGKKWWISTYKKSSSCKGSLRFDKGQHDAGCWVAMSSLVLHEQTCGGEAVAFREAV